MAERALRRGMQWRRIGFGSRSPQGEVAVAGLLLVIAGLAYTPMEQKFMLPGCDGELDPSINIWLKGIVFTSWADMSRPVVKAGYRVSAGFKRGVSAVDPPADFRALYERVAFVATQRMSELVPSDPGPAVSILCHGWRLLGEAGNVATAFITLALRPPEVDNGPNVERPPSAEELRAPGGTSFEDLARLAQQRPDELYSEFDFTKDSVPGSDLITVSYAETIPEVPESDPFAFKPCVERAEAFANSYHRMLERFGEVTSPFRAKRREWFLVDRKLATIHICFSR
jgi:hypothetical protein